MEFSVHEDGVCLGFGVYRANVRRAVNQVVSLDGHAPLDFSGIQATSERF
jgi:hypothetical protein